MKITKDLTNVRAFDPLLDIHLSEDIFLDLHNDFIFVDMVWNRPSQGNVIISFVGDDRSKSVQLVFESIKSVDFRFEGISIDLSNETLLNGFSKGELGERYKDTIHEYFFVDLTNGLHLDIICKKVFIDYEAKQN